MQHEIYVIYQIPLKDWQWYPVKFGNYCYQDEDNCYILEVKATL